MNTGILSVRELKKEDIESIVEYWFGAKVQFLLGMGVDIKKMPKREEYAKMLREQLKQKYHEKKSYCTIWLVNDTAVGHCNVSDILFGQQAAMHLHLWNSDTRQKGLGTDFVKLSLGYFFDNLLLEKLYSEPYSLNPPPNKTLERVGFKFIKNYVTTPGFINFEQPVNRWELTYEEYKKLGE